MKRISNILSLSVLLMSILGFAACNQDEGSITTPVVIADPLTLDALTGTWTSDIDHSSEQSLATMIYNFSPQESSARLTLLDIDNAKVLDEQSVITSCEIVKDFLPEPNDKGHTEALLLTYEGIDHPYIYLVDGFNKDSINLYMPFETEGEIHKVPITLVRQKLEGNTAQPVEMSQEEIDAVIRDLVHPTKPILNNSSSNKNWMSQLDGRLLLCDIAIPGTHDSGTSTVDYLSEFAALTQKLNIGKQFDAGIRAFDLRVRQWPLSPGGVELCHGPMSCNLSFLDAFRTIVKKVKGTGECAILFINTESNPLGSYLDGWPTPLVEILQTLLLNRVVTIRTSELDEAKTREYVRDIIKENLDESMLCLYRPDLTLEEARGKIIIFNRMPKDYRLKDYAYVGQVLPNDFDIEYSDDKYSFKNATKENDWYFAKPSKFSSNEAFDNTRMEEYDNLAALANHQLETGETKILFSNNPSSSYPQYVFGTDTELCNYASAAASEYPHFIETNNALRSCGIFRQDYAGEDEVKNITMQEFVNIVIEGLPFTLSVSVLTAKVLAYEALKPSTEVCGKKMVQSVLDMNRRLRPVRDLVMSKTFIDNKIGYKEKLTVGILPRDANIGRDIVSWESDNTSVATVDNEGNVEIVGYGNAVITVTSSNDCKAVTYVCCKKNSTRPLELGLSVKWADRNLGAANPNNEGILFAWADSTISYAYSLDKYKWTREGQMTKYNATDGRLTIEQGDDIAHKMLGGKWRMPTRAEVEELINSATITPIEIDGGRHALQLEKNGVKMILPETSYRGENGIIKATPPAGYFWTSTIYQDATTHAANWYQAYCLRTEIRQDYHVGLMNFGRHFAMPVRPVQDR